MNQTLSILIADDHGIVRAGIRSILDETGNNRYSIVGEASDGQMALDLYKKLHPDIVILDISLPKMNGLEVLRTIKASDSTTHVIILTMHEESEYLNTAIELGAEGYLLKSSDMYELEKAIKSVSEGNRFYSEHLSNLFSEFIRKKGSPATASDDPKNILSQREIEILREIVEGLSNKMISGKLNISDKTVSIHRTKILKKLNAKNTAELVKIAITKKVI